jgi:hypothetical protein
LVAHPEFPLEVVYYRNFVGVVFDDSTSGPTIYQILARHGATIVGGGIQTYILQVADPGPTLAALDSVIAAIASEAGVRYAIRVDRRDRIVSREGTPPLMPILTVDADTNPPPVPPGIAMPEPLLKVNFPADTSVAYARNALFVQFDDTTRAATIRATLLRYQAQIIGGYPRAREYEIQIPDPGATYQALDSIINLIGREAGVNRVRALELRTRIQTPGRYPNEGAHASKTERAL